MLPAILRTAAAIASLVVVIAFALFAADQFASARDQARADLGAVATLQPEDNREAVRGWLREDVDAVAGGLTAPFAWAGPGDDPWLTNGGPTLLALLVYGVGGATLARWVDQRA
ncbi:MAG TPA: hypothetical protein VGV40_08775 [Solirubrobacteraceae bacterium]|nr:hypothetical protein [Solirubrobacteraceae bacterium]